MCEIEKMTKAIGAATAVNLLAEGTPIRFFANKRNKIIPERNELLYFNPLTKAFFSLDLTQPTNNHWVLAADSTQRMQDRIFELMDGCLCSFYCENEEEI